MNILHLIIYMYIKCISQSGVLVCLIVQVNKSQEKIKSHELILELS